MYSLSSLKNNTLTKTTESPPNVLFPPKVTYILNLVPVIPIHVFTCLSLKFVFKAKHIVLFYTLLYLNGITRDMGPFCNLLSSLKSWLKFIHVYS